MRNKSPGNIQFLAVKASAEPTLTDLERQSEEQKKIFAESQARNLTMRSRRI